MGALQKLLRSISNLSKIQLPHLKLPHLIKQLDNTRFPNLSKVMRMNSYLA